jgi:exosortase D (VPLPA-CTERM-specific)
MSSHKVVWREPPLSWAVLAAAFALAVFLFLDGVKLMVQWWGRPEYSHGYFIPLVSLFLVWRQKDRLARLEGAGGWAGALVVALGLAVYFAGEFSTLYTVVQYGFVVVLLGLALAFLGWQGFRLVAVPLLILFFMIPLPNFLYNNLSQTLQLLSSGYGVSIIRLFGVPVYLDGNVIDLGIMKLQVVEACNGLRYLFPLMTIGFVVAYMYKAAFWKRALVFLSTIPITVFMNSLRIALIGITVQFWGREMAEGFLHDFEGWAVFMVSFGILVLEMWALNLVGGERRPFRQVFALELPAPAPADAEVRYRRLSRPLLAALLLLALAAAASLLLPARHDVIPEREAFADFPMRLGDWRGRRETMESIYVDALKLDDYLLADYANPAGDVVNFYVAYYATQRKGDSAHSPRSCIPGGGWEIKDLRQVTLGGGEAPAPARDPGAAPGRDQGPELPGRFRQQAALAGRLAPGRDYGGRRVGPYRANRVEIQKGDDRQLVYYWFQEQGRVLTNEYLVKLFIFWDALTRNRTDGALVRLTTVLKPGEDWAQADGRLKDFAASLGGQLGRFVPE